MGEFFKKKSTTILVISIIASIVVTALIVAYSSDSFRPDSGSEFVCCTCVAGPGSDDRIWEVRVKNDREENDRYELFINIIDPVRNKRLSTTSQYAYVIHNNEILIYHSNGKLWVIQEGNEHPLIFIVDTASHKVIMDIDKFEDSYAELKYGIEDIHVEKNFCLSFQTASRTYLYDLKKDTLFPAPGREDEEYQGSGTDEMLCTSHRKFRANFVHYSPEDDRCLILTRPCMNDMQCNYAQLLFHDTARTVIFIKKLDDTYAIAGFTNDDKKLRWEVEQDKFEDLITDYEHLDICHLPAANGKIIVGFSNDAYYYNVPEGLLCISLITGSVLWKWQAVENLD